MDENLGSNPTVTIHFYCFLSRGLCVGGGRITLGEGGWVNLGPAEVVMCLENLYGARNALGPV